MNYAALDGIFAAPIPAKVDAPRGTIEVIGAEQADEGD